MRYGSVCSGIEAATMAWHSLGWQPAFLSEIEAFPRAVLEHRYPEVPLHGDFTTIQEQQYGKIDLLVGGTPCQSFSIAGLRGGLDDGRGNLALEFCRLAQRERPRWIVWENVPGVLSSSGGRDFGSILGALAELGYGLAYRILDAQYLGVAQRRRRVFVVGYLGDWRPAAAVLFERHSMSGHPAPSRKAGRDTATDAPAGTYACGGIGSYSSSSSSSPLLRTGADKGHGCEALVVGGGAGPALTAGRCYAVETSPTLRAGGNATGGHRPPGTDVDTADSLIAYVADVANAITASLANAATGHNKDENVIAFDAYNQAETADVSKTVAARNDQDNASCVAYAIQERAICENPDAVRRLTPVECERLQGFPDGFTAIPWRKKDTPDCPDGPRYKALGNSMAVPVMHWIGQRIQMVDDLVSLL